MVTVARRVRGKVVGQAARKSAGGGTLGPFVASQSWLGGEGCAGTCLVDESGEVGRFGLVVADLQVYVALVLR